jgi:acyl carrier protein
MKERILKIISQVLKTEVDENASQNSIPQWDSLRHLNLVIELEVEFDVSFEPEEIAEMKSVSKIEELIESKIR